MELFVPAVDHSRLHPNFRRILAEGNEYDQRVMSEWAAGFIDRDNKFVVEFQTSFNSSFWELYLFACLKELEFAVDFSYQRPDFLIRKDGVEICVEAAIASNAEGAIPEWEGRLSKEVLENLERDRAIREATIRLANTLSSKYGKYKEQYSRLGHVQGRVFVIAVSAFDQPYFFLEQDQAIRRVLYAYDQALWTYDHEGNKQSLFAHVHMNSIRKDNGTVLPLGYFTSPQMKEVSAILFSNTATLGKVRALSSDPNENVLFSYVRYFRDGMRLEEATVLKSDYEESLLDGLHVYHNPFAEIPLDHSLFAYPGVTQHSYDATRRLPYDDAGDGVLMYRMSFYFASKGISKRQLRPDFPLHGTD
jgi:hypothetical protein